MANTNYDQTQNFTFYKNNYRILVWLAITLLTIVFLLFALTCYNKLTKPTPTYFATTSDGRLIEIKPIR